MTGNFVFLFNAFLFSVCLGTYMTMYASDWRRLDLLGRTQYGVVFLMLFQFIYGSVESAAQQTQVAPRHFIASFIGICFLGVTMWTMSRK